MPKKTESAADRNLATERINLKLTESERAMIDAVARGRGMGAKQMIVAAVAAFAARDEQAELADLARKMLELVKEHAARRGK